MPSEEERIKCINICILYDSRLRASYHAKSRLKVSDKSVISCRLLVTIILMSSGVICVQEGDSAKGVEHVFFRDKNEVYTTRSRWIVGLVIDFQAYEQYLLFTNETLNQTFYITQTGKTYFDGLYFSQVYRKKEYEKANQPLDGKETKKLTQYYFTLKSQLQELLIVQELHTRNWQEFQEIRRIGHSELEQARQKNRLHNIQKRSLSVLAGIFSGIAFFRGEQLRAEVTNLKQNQETTRTVLKESLSLINLTRLEVKQNRLAINKVIDKLGEVVTTFNEVIEPMRRFILVSQQIQTNINRVRDLVTTETMLIAELHRKVTKLSTGKLSPTILPAPELVDILKSIEVEIPPELMLPQDPREKPFYYYSVLTTNTLVLEDKLVISIDIPLLDVSRKLRIKEAITLPVPYQGTNLTAHYELEFEHFAVSEDGRQYVILSLEDQLNCGQSQTNYCSLTSAIEETNRHKYCTLALYQRDVKKIKEMCKVKVTNKLKLPIARYVSKGEWLVATERTFYIRKLCIGEKGEVHINVVPPYTVVTLEPGCRALSDLLELPIFFEERTEYTVMRESRITTPPRNFRMADMTIWKPVLDKNFKLELEIEKLGTIEDKPLEDLISQLDNMKIWENSYLSKENIPYIIIACLVIIVLIVIAVLMCKRKMLLKLLVNKLQNKLNNDTTRKSPEHIELGEASPCVRPPRPKTRPVATSKDNDSVVSIYSEPADIKDSEVLGRREESPCVPPSVPPPRPKRRTTLTLRKK